MAAITRTSALTVLLLPTRSNSRSCSTRSSFTWVAGEKSPISSRNSVPPSASSRRPSRANRRPVKAPFSWPNNSLSSSPSFSAAQLTFTNGFCARRTAVMDRRGDEFLSRSRLAADQHRGIAGRDLVDFEVDFAHGVRVADDVLRPELLLQGAAEPQILGFQVLPLEGLDAARLDVVGDHAGHDPQRPGPPLKLRELLHRQIDRQRADHFAAQRDGNAEKAAVGLHPPCGVCGCGW